MWLGLIMAFNVWFIIWPNQQKVLGLNGKGDGLDADYDLLQQVLETLSVEEDGA